VRRLRIACAVTLLALIGFAVALKYLASSAYAQSEAVTTDSSTHLASGLRALPLQLSTTAESSSIQVLIATTQEAAVERSSDVGAAQVRANAPVTVATNISARSLAVEPGLSSATNAGNAENSAAPQSALLYLTNFGKGNKIYTLATALNSSAASSAPAAVARLAPFAGQTPPGSLGDGGAASSAEFDLKLDSLAMRSGLAVAPDGTVFVADTLNGTIRSIAGADSSEPGIVRSVVGRFGPRQNFELVQPLGLALDRAGNLYIADRGANAVLMLRSATSDSPGVLEIVGHVVSPTSVGVTLDGAKVFAASSDTGAIVAINTKTRSIASAGISQSKWVLPGKQGEVTKRTTPQGLAVDGAGNLFVSFSAPAPTLGLGYIERLDATSGKVTYVTAGLTSPGEIAFDSNGNLFVADQGTRRLLAFRGEGIPANGVTLTPPANQVPFGPEPVAGTSPTQAFTLANNSTGTISQVSSGFQGANAADFTVLNTSCSGPLLANTSCLLNVAFVPQASGARSASLAVTFTSAGVQTTLTAAVTGTGDDYQIMPAMNVGPIYLLTVTQGSAATFQLQVVPDDTFSGPVTLICPSGSALPLATTCGISSGTTVTTPLVPMLTVNVSPNTPVPFNVTFQTTGIAIAKSGAAGPGFTGNGRGGELKSPAGLEKSPARTGFLRGFAYLSLILSAVFAFLSFRRVVLPVAAMRRAVETFCNKLIFSARVRQSVSVVALFVLFVTILAGCHHSSSTGIVVTPKGTTNLTVQGGAQNATRGFTVTLVVN
jgi:sugar lactone lactonase YvrE